MAGGHDPMVQGRRLRSELRRARQAAGLTQKEVADALDWSASKLIRIERGAVGVSITDLRALLTEYGITDAARVDELVEMARVSKRPAWWTKYRHVFSPPFVSLLGYEASAAVIRHYHGGAVPALLQTEDYARAVIAAHTADAGRIDDLVSARMERQELLDREEPPTMHYILDEAVIRRWVGGPKVMRDQLAWLKELASRPGIDIRIVPFSAGTHPGMRGPFLIYEFPPDEDEDYIVFLESNRGHTLLRNETGEVSGYLDRFAELGEKATPADRLNDVLDDAIADLDGRPGAGRAAVRREAPASDPAADQT